MPPRRPQGFSLVEIIIAMSIFVVFFLAVLETWPLSQKAVAQARNVVAATQIGQQQMELALYQASKSFTTDYSVAATTVTLVSKHNGVSQSQQYTYTVSAPGGSTSPKNIYVQVKWSEGGASGRSVQRALQFETMLAKPQ